MIGDVCAPCPHCAKTLKHHQFWFPRNIFEAPIAYSRRCSRTKNSQCRIGVCAPRCVVIGHLTAVPTHPGRTGVLALCIMLPSPPFGNLLSELTAWRDSVIPPRALSPRAPPPPKHALPATATTSTTNGSRTPPATVLPPPQPHSPLHVFICLMALSALVIGLAPAAAAYMTSWGSMLWFWVTQGPVVETVPHRYTATPVPSMPRTPPTRTVPIRLQLPCRHIIHYIVLLLIIGGATDQWAHDPAKVDTTQTCNRTTRRRAALHRRQLRPLPWNMNRLPWQLRLLSLLLSHCQACSQPHPQPISPSYYYPHSGEVTGTISSSHVMWDLARRLLLLNNDIHPLPGPGRPHTFKVLSLNVGGPHLSKKRWNQLL